jgi:hypothetical protein
MRRERSHFSDADESAETGRQAGFLFDILTLDVSDPDVRPAVECKIGWESVAITIASTITNT